MFGRNAGANTDVAPKLTLTGQTIDDTEGKAASHCIFLAPYFQLQVFLSKASG